MVKRLVRRTILIIVAVMVIVSFYLHAPIVTGDWTRQTIYLWCLNSCHIQDKNPMPRMLLIDDDGGEGVFVIKQLCDELHIKATFAVVPAMMSKRVCDSLLLWQEQGYDIAIHGYNHEDWRGWSREEVFADIEKCEKQLDKLGFNISNIKYVVAPRSSNSREIRKAIKDKKYQMITGANIINPDTTVFQMGRMVISNKMNLTDTEDILRKAKKENGYIIFGTHSSIPDEFSKEKTKAVIKMSLDMGFVH